MSEIVILSGSPSSPSRTDLALNFIQGIIEQHGFKVTTVSVRDFPEGDLIHARYNSPDIKKFSELIEKADGVIIGSPVYKASYTGVLKTVIDLLPEGALKNKPVLPIMVGGSPAHLLAIDYALKPLIAVLKGQPLQGIYIIDKKINKENLSAPIEDKDLLQRITVQAEEFREAIQKVQVIHV